MGACNSTLLDGALVYGLISAAFLLGMAVACWFSMTPSLCARCEQQLDAPDAAVAPPAQGRERCDDEHLTKATRNGGAN